MNINLTDAEWNLMECLWRKSPRTGRETAEYLRKSVGWKRSTTLTMLRRMSEKGLVKCEKEDGINVYSPLVNKDEAVVKKTKEFLDRIYNGSVSMLVSALTKKQRLTKEEVEELYAILEAEKKGEDK